jgi:cytochrome c2
MRSLLRSQALGLAWLLLGAVGILAGCAPDASAEIISPQLGAQLYAKEANEVVEAAPTAEPLRIATMPPEAVTAGLPEDFATALAAADPGNGQNVALTYGCVGCHSLDPNVTLAGPTWVNVGDTAANRQPGVSPAAYLHSSITTPDTYVVPTFPDTVMPEVYKDTIPQDDLADIIAFLLAQHEQ